MKKLIINTNSSGDDSYQVYATLGPTIYGSRQLKFTSVWSKAKDPTAEQNKFEMFLDPQALANLKELLEASE